MHVLLCRLDGIYAFQLLQEHESESRCWEHTPPSWNPAFEKDRDSFLSQGICDHLAGNLVISLPRIIYEKTYGVGRCLNAGFHDIDWRTCRDGDCTTQRRRQEMQRCSV